MKFDAAYDPNVQEALSRCHGNATAVILPLRSGAFAIFDNRWTLREIREQWPSADEIRAISTEFDTSAKAAVVTANTVLSADNIDI